MSLRDDPPVEAFFRRIRRRAHAAHALESGVATAGAAALLFALAAIAIGPLAETGVAALLFVGVLAVLAIGAARWARGLRALRGGNVARLLGTEGADLPSAARSAYEMAVAPPAHASAALVLAHRSNVALRLAAVPPARIAGWRTLSGRHVAIGAVAVLVALGLLATERGRAGAYALTHPGERDAAGERVAVVFTDVDARLIFPTYLARDAETVRGASVLEVPRGTSVELRAVSRLDATEAAVRVGERTVQMERSPTGEHVGRFVAREDTPLLLRARLSDGSWVRDAHARAVHVIPDEAPQVSLLEPTSDITARELAQIDVRWMVTDDIGVASLDLVIDRQGETERRRVGSYPEGERPTEAFGNATLDLALLGLARGDSITFYVEARDGDVVSGPNVARSASITVTRQSEASLRDQQLEDLRGLLDSALFALADRLERDVPEAESEASARFDALRPGGRALVDGLEAQSSRIRSQEGGREADAALLRSMASRLRRLLREEAELHRGRVGSLAARTRVDGRLQGELEEDTLTLDDLLSRARIDDAAAIARELEALRREIRSLLSELARTDSDEARARLLEAIGRAQERMRELSRRLAEMGTSVPQEFTNQGEMASQESQDTLEALREAVQRGDLDRAQQLADELQHQIDRLASALGQSGEDFAESRFGPRDRAMANAMESLGELEAEQQRLAQRGGERRSRAAHRALEAIGGRDNRIGRQLAEETERVQRAAEEIQRDRLASFEQETFDRVRQRLIDAQDALRAGDLGEGRAMAEAAATDLGMLSRDLDLSALMFPGHDGETSQDARTARQADRRLEDLLRQLDEALPDVGSHLAPPDRTQMQEDLASQRDAHRAADRLAQSFAEGPDGAPLSEDAAREVGEAGHAMAEAERAIERNDPLESARLQEEAARRLAELREQLEQQQQSSSGGGGSGGSELDFTNPVEIPDADQFEGPMERRRRLLDAMQRAAPEGYEDAVRRYYEELLR
ncbi:MAG: DUF4175 family protein [Sandaracinaceae bacterium]